MISATTRKGKSFRSAMGSSWPRVEKTALVVWREARWCLARDWMAGM
jgi:hypothetical protein